MCAAEPQGCDFRRVTRGALRARLSSPRLRRCHLAPTHDARVAMRTFVADSAGMRNRLDEETSPYLKQHAANPVQWQPWDPTAHAAARESAKPILLPVGYSACHWCHVMAHESFEDAETAQHMNALYVNIKVDREERPDLDKIYQTAHHLYTGRPGGWPLTVFLTPDTHIPIFTGTYFPKDRRYG